MASTSKFREKIIPDPKRTTKDDMGEEFGASKNTVMYLKCKSPEQVANIRRMAAIRGFPNHPGNYLISLFEQDSELNEKRHHEDKTVDESDLTLEQKRAKLAQKAGFLKTSDLSGGRYEALVWLKNHINYGNEKEDYFLRTLDPMLMSFTEKLRKHKEANLSKVILGKYRQAMWDYVCSKGGTIELKTSQIPISEDDIAKYIELASVMIELTDINDKIAEERMSKRKKSATEESVV